MKKHFPISLLLCIFASLLPVFVHAATFDPSSHWQTIKTEHFFIRYPKAIESVAQDAARIFEEVHAKLSPKLEWKPWGRTEVILTDSTDDSNGMTVTLPYNWMILYVVPPEPDSSLANYDDWLRTLFTHEYTHLLHIDASRFFWKPFRYIFGKLVAPMGLTPRWVREGFSVYEETIGTTAGRNRASYSEMLVRTAIFEDNFPAIDEAGGLQWEWPTYNTAYLFGGRFVEYLVNTYGEDKFLLFNKRLQGSPLLSMINHQARNVYHKTFYELWREWQASLRSQYDEQKSKLDAEGATPLEPVVTSKWDEQLSSPTLSPDGKKLAYVSESPHRKPEIRIRDLETGEDELVAKQGASSISFSPDGTQIAYSAMSAYKRYNMYYDTWLYNLETKKRTILTSGERARDPDFDPSGKKVIFVAGSAGTDVLKLMNIETREITALTEPQPKYIRYSRPRFSPDGRLIAVNIKKNDEQWKIAIYKADEPTGDVLSMKIQTFIEKGGLNASPLWSADGKYLFFTSDESGITNVYRADVQSGTSTKLSNVLTGVFEPSTRDGQTIYVREYHSKGFVISKFEAQPPPVEKKGKKAKKQRSKEAKLRAGKEEKKHETNRENPPLPPFEKGGSGGIHSAARGNKYHKKPKDISSGEQSVPEGDQGEPKTLSLPTGEGGSEVNLYPTQKYSPFGKSLFLPRYLLPNIAYIENAALISVTTGGNDVLHWHNWMAGGSYRTDANFLGYNARYFYNRYRPILGFGVNDFAVDFGNLVFVDTKTGNRDTVHYYEERRYLNAFAVLPIRNHSFTLSYFHEYRKPKTSLTPQQQDALNLGTYAGFYANYTYSDAEMYPASISPENGRTIKLTGIITNSIFASREKNEQDIAAGDWREYIRLWHHHVLALRATGGIAWGDKQAQGTFGFGGAVGEGNLAAGSAYNYFPLRGLPYVTLSKTRAMLLSGEYRLPIVSPQRGIGTWPFFIKNLYAAFFADYGDAWNAGDNDESSFTKFFQDFFLGVGTELRGDFVIGHGLPVTGRVGYAIIVVNRDRLDGYTDPLLGTSMKNGTLMLQLGTSF